MNHRIAAIFISFAVSILLFTGGLILAQEGAPPEEECLPGEIVTGTSSVSSAFRCDEFAVYRCVNNACGKAKGAMEQGKKWYMCKTTTETWTDGCDSGNTSDTEHVSGPHGPDQIRSFGEVGDYQVCSAGYNDWGTVPPTPECSGSCYPAPNLKTLDDESLLPKNVSENAKYKLPVNFGWEDNVEKEIAKAPSHCAVKAYEFNVADPPISKITAGTQLQNIEDQPYKLECRLKPSSAYQWKVRACLDEGGTDCGEWQDSQNFDTGPAPELTSPYDSDWSGKDEAKNIGLPTTLDWCDVEEAESWLMQIHIVENGVEKCHPWLADGTNCGTWPVRKEKKPPPYKEKPKLLSEFFDKEGFFTKNTDYSWRLATCLREDNTDCSSFSQQWQFKTADVILTDFTLIYPPNDPLGQTPVGLPINFEWAGRPGTNSFNYTIGQFSGTTLSRGVTLDYDKLSLDTSYQWTVEPCWDYEGKKCETDLIKTGYFKTTGAPPALNYPAPNASDVIIPINFNWDDVPGAKSYVMKISGNGLSKEMALNDKLEAKLDYPDLKMSSNYSWQVKTCAREGGQICGPYGSPQSFKTFKLSPPGTPEAPSNGGTLFTDERSVSWKKVDGAKAYEYQIKYLSADAEEQDQSCASAVGRELFGQPKNVSVNSDFVELLCLGQYQWQARSCLDQPCQETGDWSGAWTFTLSEGGAAKGGLAPCGRKADTAGTPWNEREPCQVKHLFLLVKIIIDFLLFRLVPFGLVLLTIYTAFIFYLSWKGVGALAQVISLWKATGAGLVIMFFAWTAVNFFLKLIGYQIGIFGNWHQL